MTERPAAGGGDLLATAVQQPDRLAARLKEVPSEPGCYLMRDTEDRILYIGKAKVLRHRVRSYFQTSHAPQPPHPPDGAAGGGDRIHRHRQ
jgi:hypothetical protein